MVAFRWFLAIAFTVLADLANPALPGTVEAFVEVEEAVRLSGYQRQVTARDRDDFAAARHAEAAKTSRAVAFRHRAIWPDGLAPGRPARKIPAPGTADTSSAPDDH